MNSKFPTLSNRRIIATLAMALVIAGLMLVAAWMKQSSADGSLAAQLCEGTILVLATLAMFIPLLTLPRPTATQRPSREPR
jgi:hypothetical protein